MVKRRTEDDFRAEQAAKNKAKATTLLALNNQRLLQEHTQEIHRLNKCLLEEAVEIGCRLTEVKNILDHGDWLHWLEREFAWTDRHAQPHERLRDGE
jgi:Protein of unknown function (DUF3102)